MVTKANKEDEDKRLRAERKLELAEQRQVEAELKHLKMKQHQMLLADKMRESERLRVSAIGIYLFEIVSVEYLSAFQVNKPDALSILKIR